MEYYLFKKITGEFEENLLYSENTELWNKLPINKYTVLSFIFDDHEQHYYFNSQLEFIPFNKEEGFIFFLTSKGAKHYKFEIESYNDGIMTTKNGDEIFLSSAWIPTGYEYRIVNKADNSILAEVQVPKSGKINLTATEKTTEIIFKHKGERKDPVIARAFAKHSSDKKSGCVFGIIIFIILAIGIYIFGGFVSWFLGLFGIKFDDEYPY